MNSRIKGASPRPPYWTRGTLWAKNHREGMCYATVTTPHSRYALCAQKWDGSGAKKWYVSAYVEEPNGGIRWVARTPHGNERGDALTALRDMEQTLREGQE